MTANLKYLWYVLKHKWYVIYAGLKLHVPLWQLITHDWSKFTRAEWGPYVRRFYGDRGDDLAFSDAVQHHYNHNPHHWNYWLVHNENDTYTAREMPELYVREMVADWYSANRCSNGAGIITWYQKNYTNYILHENTRRLLEFILVELSMKVRNE